MALTTAAEVLKIMDNCSVAELDITTNYIPAASALITKVFEDDTEIGSTLQEEIERWFTAHMIACSRFRTAEQEKIGDASIKYTGKWSEGLRSTPYGQMVLQLDFTGKMAALSKRRMRLIAIKSFD
jgi:hypothetical protein